jgi:GNAT superfamily N-acetyltransferase
MRAPPLTITPVDADEAAAVARFIAHVIRTSVDASDAEQADFIAHTRRNVEQWAAAPDAALHLKCADAGGALLGVVMAKQHWNLCHLFVAPAAQGQGLGRALLEAAVTACRARNVRPYVRVNASRNAAGFYEHLGFVRVPDAPARHAGLQFELPL